MVIKKISLLCLFVFSLCVANLYENDLLLKITLKNTEQFDKIKQIEGLHVWNDAWHIKVSILAHVNIKNENSTRIALKHMGVVYQIMCNNLRELIDEQKKSSKLRKLNRIPGGYLNFGTYNTLQDIYDFIDILPLIHPIKTRRFTIGRTYENREIKGFVVSQNVFLPKPIIFFECGIHAREWISPALCLWVANQLITTNNPLLNRFEFHFIPVLNPDGYVYTWTVDRLWRKNRSPNGNNCFGTDLNRNFDVAFCQFGASNDPCNPQTYCGSSAFSELESRALRDYILRIGSSIVAYFDFHNFSQFWMYPFSFSTNPAPNNAQLNSLSNIAVTALTAIYGTNYTVNEISQLVGATSGSTLDWVYNNIPSKLCFAIELRDTGDFGFLLPELNIAPTSIETWAGVTAILNNI